MTMLVFADAAFVMNADVQAKKYNVIDIIDGGTVTGQVLVGNGSE